MSSFEDQMANDGGGTSAAAAAATAWTIFEEGTSDDTNEMLTHATTAAPIPASVAPVAVTSSASSPSPSSSLPLPSTLLACVHNRRQAYARMSPQEAKCDSEHIEVENFGELQAQQVGDLRCLCAFGFCRNVI